MRRSITCILAGVFLAAAAPGFAATTTIPFSTTIGDNPCTNEAVAVAGELLVITHVADSGETYSATSVLVPRRVTGVGLDSGESYAFVGATHSTFTLAGSGQTQVTDTVTMNLVSPEGSGNLLFTGVFHETVNANGDVTAIVEQTGARCTG
jgi:hypothetical protein